MHPHAPPCIPMQPHASTSDLSSSCTTVRMLESLVRVAQAHARLTAKHVVTLDDALVAVMVVESSQNCLMVCVCVILQSTIYKISWC